MVQELLPYLPQASTADTTALCIAIMIVGALMWLCGAVWSRGLLTLAAVALGGTLGMMMPRWQNWPINTMAACVLGAVFCGLSAFVLPRVWVGLMLGVVLSAWVALAVWINFRGGAPWPWRAAWEVAMMTPPEHALDIWQRMPETVRRVVPYGAGTAMISALSLALLFPRVGRLMCFSAGGVTMLFLSALVLICSRRPDWLMYVPPRMDAQAAALGILVLLGMVLQWQFLPSRREVPWEPHRHDDDGARAALPSSRVPHKFA